MLSSTNIHTQNHSYCVAMLVRMQYSIKSFFIDLEPLVCISEMVSDNHRMLQLML